MGTPTSVRYCPRCAAEVEASGGHCLLGHRLVEPEAGSISELRAEVDRVFEQARNAVAASILQAAGPPPPPPPPWGAPPVGMAPPPPSHSVWSGLERIETGTESLQDPIVAFAPGPRMDWGPEKAPRKGRWRRESGTTA